MLHANVDRQDVKRDRQCEAILQKLKKFMSEEVLPVEAEYFSELKSLDNSWVVLPIINELKNKAKALGLWNLFLPSTAASGALKTQAMLSEILKLESCPPI